MRPFELVEPTSIEEACAILAENGEIRPIAGGTALLTLIKQGIFAPRRLVNLKKIRACDEVSYDPQHGLRIGALASVYDVETCPVVRQHYPELAEACHLVANIRIRNMATIGGNLAHGDYQSDPPTILVALDAGVELVSRSGARRMEITDFLRGSYETALEPGELVAAVVVPPAPHGLRGRYVKFTTGSSEERPCAGVAVLVCLEGGICRDLRLAIGAVSPTPLRVRRGEAMARGEKLTAKLIEKIATEAAHAAEPIDDLRGPADYKRHLIQVLVRRALAACAGS